MEPVKIKTMYDHNRPVHLSLLRKAVSSQPYCSQDSFIIQVQKGMIEGEPLLLHVKNQLCQVHAYLTRLPRQRNEPLGPTPLIYTLQITELSIPLSTIAL